MKKTALILTAIYALGTFQAYASVDKQPRTYVPKNKNTIDQLLLKQTIKFQEVPTLTNKIGHDESVKEETTCVGDFYLYDEAGTRYLIGTTTCKNGPYAIFIYTEEKEGSKKFNKLKGVFIDSNCDGLLERSMSDADRLLPECMKK